MGLVVGHRQGSGSLRSWSWNWALQGALAAGGGCHHETIEVRSRGGCSCSALGQKQVKVKRGRKNKSLRVLQLPKPIPGTPQHLAARSALEAGPGEEAQHRVPLQRITRPRHLPGQGHRHEGHRQGRERGRKEISEFSSRVLWPLHLKSFTATGWCFADSTWLIVFRKATFPASYRHHVHSKPSTPGNPVNFPCYTPVKEAAPGHSSARPPPHASLLENRGPKPSPSPGTVGFMLQDSMPHLCPSPAKEAGQFCYKQKIETT